MSADFYWNPEPLLVAIESSFRAAAEDVRAAAAAKAWKENKAVALVYGPGGATLAGRGRLSGVQEHGARAHPETPKNKKAMKFAGGGFAKGTIQHPATKAQPYLHPAAALLEGFFNAQARARLPK